MMWWVAAASAGGVPLSRAEALFERLSTPRLVAVGEAPHWTVAVPELVGELVQEMCEAGACPDLVALECPYSLSPWLDAYTTSPNADLATVRGHPCLMAGGLGLLEQIRALNLERAGAGPIHVGGVDVEHQYARHSWLPAENDADALEEIAAGLEHNAWGPTFVEQVVENTETTWAAYRSGLGRQPELNEIREQAMLRNLTDPDRLGRFWFDAGRAVFYGGSGHTRSTASCERGWLACELDREMAVHSVLVRVVRLDLRSIPADDPACAQPATAYLSWLRDMRSLREVGGQSQVPWEAPAWLQRLARRRPVWIRDLSVIGLGHDELIVVPVSDVDLPVCG
jgi:hypothetical protein